MQVLLSALLLTTFAVDFIACEKNFEMHYIKTVDLNDTENDLYTYEIQKVDKVNETTFIVSCELNQLQELDDSWMVTIEVFHNPEKKEEFKHPFMKFPKTGVCKFFKTTYKTHLYEKIKSFSNAPDPDVCPVVKEKYLVKDFIFNGDKMKPGPGHVGLWRIDIFVSKDDVTLKGAQIFVEVAEKKD